MLSLSHRIRVAAASRRQVSGGIKKFASGGVSSYGVCLQLSDGGYLLFSSVSGGFVVLRLDEDLTQTDGAEITFSGSASNLIAYSAVEGPGGEIYLLLRGRLNDDGSVYLMALTAGLELQWQRKISTSESVQGYSLTLNNGFLYVSVGSGGTAGKAHILKYSTTGVLQWQTHVANAAGTAAARCHDHDDNGNIYLLCTANPAGAYYTGLVKLNSSGGEVAQRYIVNSTASISAVTRDASGNFYAVGSAGNYMSPHPLVIKFDSSLNQIWSRELLGSPYAAIRNVEYRDGELCMIAYGSTEVLVARLDVYGAILAQREFTPASGAAYIYDALQFDAARIIAGGGFGGELSMFDILGDSDGLGTYGGQLTVTEPGYTMDTYALSSGASSLTVAAGSLSDTAAALTVSPLATLTTTYLTKD